MDRRLKRDLRLGGPALDQLDHACRYQEETLDILLSLTRTDGDRLWTESQFFFQCVDKGRNGHLLLLGPRLRLASSHRSLSLVRKLKPAAQPA